MTDPLSPQPKIISWERAKDFLTILVIPVFLWCGKVSINLEVLGEKVGRAETTIEKLDVRLEAQRERSTETHERLARVEVRLVGLTERINEIKSLLERIVP